MVQQRRTFVRNGCASLAGLIGISQSVAGRSDNIRSTDVKSVTGTVHDPVTRAEVLELIEEANNSFANISDKKVDTIVPTALSS
ncbi:hypothetical protein [Halorubellus sp. PRR65]|uniref:hypothetical protein n=1 Tax=Halorubellus sp. PRR65 TaxID=3098148 RepID=UPI002B260FD5|nr:hypothetical protein [Halorubellus sp. PRR65]